MFKTKFGLKAIVVIALVTSWKLPFGFDGHSYCFAQENKTGSAQADAAANESSDHLKIKGLEDVPPSPPGFKGEDQPLNADIPEDIQRRLVSYTGESAKNACKLVTYPHPKVRYDAIQQLFAYAIGDEDIETEVVIQALRKALKDPVEKNRLFAMSALEDHKEKARNALPELAFLAQSGNEKQSAGALTAIGSIGAPAVPVVPMLLAELKKDDPSKAGYIYRALRGIGPGAKAAIPRLIGKLNDEQNGGYFAETIAMIGGESELLDKLKNGTFFEKLNAADGFDVLPEHSPETISALSKILAEHTSTDLRFKAVEGLAVAKPVTKEIVDALGVGTKDKHWAVCLKAVEALGSIEPPLKEAIPYLTAASNNSDERVATAANKSLTRFDIGMEARLTKIIDAVVEEQFIPSEVDEILKKDAEKLYPLIKSYLTDESNDANRRAFLIKCFRPLLENEVFSKEEKKKEVVEFVNSLRSPKYPGPMRGVAAIWLTTKAYLDFKEFDFQAIAAGMKESESPVLLIEFAHLLSGNGIKESIPDMVAKFSINDPRLNESLIRSLGKFGKDADMAIPKLLEFLKNDELYGEREAAANAIGEIATQHEKCIPILMSFAENHDELARASCVALAKIIRKNDLDATKALETFRKAFEDGEEDGWGTSKYLEAIGELGAKGAPSVELLVEQLDKTGSSAAIDALGNIGPPAKDAMPKLVECLKKWDKEEFRFERQEVYQAISKIGEPAEPFVQLLPDLLKDIDQRKPALQTIGAIGKKAKAAAPAVMTLLQSEDGKEKILAAQTLALLGSTDPKVIAALKSMVKKEDQWYANHALDALAKLVPDDREFRPQILKRVCELDVEHQETYFESLGELAKEVIEEALVSTEWSVKMAAYRYLPDYFSKDEVSEKLNDLIQLSKSEDSKARREAIGAIGEMSVEPERSVPVLVDKIDDTDYFVQRSALEGLAVFQADAAPAIDKLASLITEGKFRRDAIECAGAIGPKAKPLVPVLIKVVAEESANENSQALCFFAIIALGDIGPDAKAALPILEKTRDSENDYLKKPAAEAIKKILNKTSDQ